MSDFIVGIRDRLEKSPWVIVLFLLFGYATWLGWKFFLEDYQANMVFYQSIPTLKASGIDLIAYMARFIQIAPIIFGYIFLRDTNKILYGIGTAFFLAIDWGIGAYYRSAGFSLSPGWNMYAIAEDFIFFTVGSEILLALCGSISISLAVPAVQQLFQAILKSINEKQEADKIARSSGGKPPTGRPSGIPMPPQGGRPPIPPFDRNKR